jgi:hypothetical protein
MAADGNEARHQVKNPTSAAIAIAVLLQFEYPASWAWLRCRIIVRFRANQPQNVSI